MSKRWVAAWWIVVVSCVASIAEAHENSVRYVDVALASDGAALVVRVAAADVAVALGEDLDWYELEAHAEAASALLMRGLLVASDGAPCGVTTAAPELVPGAGATFVQLRADVRCEPGVLTLLDASLEDEGHRTLVTVAGMSHVLRGEDRELTLSAPPGALATAKSFAYEGVVHLVTGFDHVLFLLSLLFAAGVVARRKGKRAAVKEIALVVTAFTVGHSVTLALAALDVVQPNIQWVESIIAASIVLVAMLNVLAPEHSMGRPWIALAFGLVHGFGFSSVLAEVGLPAGQRAVALFSFNVGIELAQLAVVVVLIAPLAWLATREHFYRAVIMRAGSLAIAALASYWLIERAFGLA
jgi:hypothetical protein